MDQRVLVDVIANAFLSYEHATDAEADPDWAVTVMEGLSATLQQLSVEDRSEFEVALDALASELPDDPSSDGRRDFYRGLPGLLGWEQPVLPRGPDRETRGGRQKPK